MSTISRLLLCSITNQARAETAHKAVTLRCPNTAIKMAQLCREGGGDLCHTKEIYWLCQAAEYSNGVGIKDLIDLDGFLEAVTTIDEVALIHPYGEEVVEAIHRADSIRSLHCMFAASRSGTFLLRRPNHIEGIGKFLQTTNKIQTLTLGGNWSGWFFDDDTIPVISEPLAFNGSITHLDAWSRISSKGASKLIQAIGNNPASKIQSLDFWNCHFRCDEEFRQHCQAAAKIEIYFPR